MGVFGHLFGHRSERDSPALLLAIERAVSAVEPLLKQINGYPDSYRKPVAVALEYAHRLAASVPGPVMVDLESYASDTYVHALFPSVDLIRDALCTSHTIQDYLHEPSDVRWLCHNKTAIEERNRQAAYRHDTGKIFAASTGR
jgi:hypothetical protein